MFSVTDHLASCLTLIPLSNREPKMWLYGLNIWFRPIVEYKIKRLHRITICYIYQILSILNLVKYLYDNFYISGTEGYECGWSAWSQWTPCDRVCGSGSSWRERACMGAASGGVCRDCVGHAREARECNTHSCQGKQGIFSNIIFCLGICQNNGFFTIVDINCGYCQVPFYIE